MIERVATLAIALVTLALSVQPAAAQAGIDPRRIASCQLAAENMRQRVRPETDAYARYDAEVVYWSAHVERFVPDADDRASLLSEGRTMLNQSAQQQGYMAGMVMVAQVLEQCNANRSVIEGATPNG